MKIKRECPTCGHTYEVEACPECGGKGYVRKPKDFRGFLPADHIPCQACGGTGEKGCLPIKQLLSSMEIHT